MKNLIYLVFMFFSLAVFGQTGSIEGTLVDANTKEPLPFANVYIMVDGFVQGAQTDFDGKYKIFPVKIGEYELTAEYIGYEMLKVPDVIVRDGVVRLLNLEIKEEDEMLYDVIILDNSPPFFNFTEGNITTFYREDIKNMLR